MFVLSIGTDYRLQFIFICLLHGFSGNIKSRPSCLRSRHLLPEFPVIVTQIYSCFFSVCQGNLWDSSFKQSRYLL